MGWGGNAPRGTGEGRKVFVDGTRTPPPPKTHTTPPTRLKTIQKKEKVKGTKRRIKREGVVFFVGVKVVDRVETVLKTADRKIRAKQKFRDETRGHCTAKNQPQSMVREVGLTSGRATNSPGRLDLCIKCTNYSRGEGEGPQGRGNYLGLNEVTVEKKTRKYLKILFGSVGRGTVGEKKCKKVGLKSKTTSQAESALQS